MSSPTRSRAAIFISTSPPPRSRRVIGTLPRRIFRPRSAAPVTSIGEYALASRHSLTSVTLPDGLKSIGNYAFKRCRVLNDINIPESVTSIGDSAFVECYRLSSITLPEGLTKIGYSVFDNTALTSITIPSTVTCIENDAFNRCSSLRNVYFFGNAPSLAENAFLCHERPDTLLYREKKVGRARNGTTCRPTHFTAALSAN